MSTEENNYRDQKPMFRIVLDLAMGLLYLVLAGIAFNMRSFGKLELPASLAYMFGGLLVIYGLFRIYLGIKSLKDNRRA